MFKSVPNEIAVRIGLVFCTIPATLGVLNPTATEGIMNTLMFSSLLFVGPWLLKKVSEDIS